MKYLVEVETSTLKTYEVRHMSQKDIEARFREFDDALDPVEEHEQSRIASVVEMEDD